MAVAEPLALLQVAAVIGVEFDVDVVARVLGRSVGSLLTDIEEARADGTLVEEGTRLRFADARFRDHLYEGLAQPVRQALHRDVAREYLRPGSEPEAAWHLTRSTGRLTEVELRVIRHAITRLGQVAPEEAAELALQVSAHFRTRDPHHMEFITTAAKHLGNTRRVGEALALVEQRYSIGLSVREEGQLRLVAAHLHQAAGDDTEAMSHLSRALGLPGLDEELRLLLMKTKTVGHVNLGEIDDAIRLSELLAESVRRSTDPAVKLSADLFFSQLAFSQARVTKALELAEKSARSLEVSAARPLPAPRIPELWLATVLLSTDRSNEASELLLEGQRNAERRGFAWSMPYWHTVRAIERYIHDELDDAVAEAETALHAADTLDVLRYVPLTRSVLAIVEAHRGHVPRACELVRDAELPARPRTYDMWTAAAWMRLGGQWQERAGSWLGQHANRARIMSLPPRVWPDLVRAGEGSQAVRALLDQIGQVAADQQVVARAIAAARTAGARPAVPGRSRHRPSAGWESLTAAELRVAELVVAGQTNRSIAAQLHVSIHTVGTHLRHVFTKLDINTRVELTRLTLQHGLTTRTGGYSSR
ncbi:helix-turn-helix transcriptional regulator [Streptomyces sp. NPDC005708]|uniref:helix-turn-helix transcriptional regulator n=1 Tax=Streptomyces sp. NPDC005708 TaxID=3154564 RepID=UPI00340483F0